MKLTLQRETLLKPLQMVQGVVEHKQVMPILANILIIIEKNTLSIIATDLEIELISIETLPQYVETPFRFTVPCRKLLDICRALPEQAVVELIIEEKNSDKVILRSGRSRYTLATLPASEFPNIDQHPTTACINLTQQNLRYLLQRTYFAMAQQDVRYYLNGLLLEFSPNSINAIGTDGHRLAYNTLPITLENIKPIRIIIPRKSVLELMRLLENSSQEITLEISQSNVRVVDKNFIFTAKLIEGRFPDYQQAIPRHNDRRIVLERDIFKQALSRSAVVSHDKFRAVYFEFKQNLLRILANNQEREFAEEELEIEYPFDELTMGFNVTYLLDVLSTLDTQHIILTFSSLCNSIVIEEPENANSAFVIMPMQI